MRGSGIGIKSIERCCQRVSVPENRALNGGNGKIIVEWRRSVGLVQLFMR